MSGLALVAAMSLVVLHRVDGGEVLLAPSHVTSMHAKALGAARDKLITGESRCIIWLSDGKQLSVLEPCETVRKLLNEAGRQ